MALIETESLILKSYPLAEADKIVVFLTRSHGLVRGVAKGAKRLKSRFGGALEPFSIVDLTFFQKEERELVSISQVELKKSFFEQASSPVYLQKFAYLAELLNEFNPPHEPNERLYRMARISLETAVEHPNNLEAVVLYFELWLLRLAGYLPFWGKCSGCGRELSDGEPANLQINFHLSCRNCQKSKNGWQVSHEQRQIFSTAQVVSPQKFIDYSAGKTECVRDVSIILKRIIAHILGKESVGERMLIAAV